MPLGKTFKRSPWCPHIIDSDIMKNMYLYLILMLSYCISNLGLCLAIQCASSKLKKKKAAATHLKNDEVLFLF